MSGSLPPGFELEEAAPASAHALPPGFELEGETPQSEQQARVQRHLPEAQRRLAESPFLPVPRVHIPLISPLANRIGAGAAAALRLGEGENFSERYANALAREQAEREAYRQRYPVSSGIASGVGLGAAAALTPALGIAAAGARLAPHLPSVLSAAPRLAGAGAEGGLYGGAEGALEAPPGANPSEVAQRALSGAQTGAAFGAGASAALPTAAKVIGGALRTARGVLDPAYRAQQRLAHVIHEAPPNPNLLTPEQHGAAVREGLPASLIDVRGANEEVRRAAGRTAGEDQTQALLHQLQERHQNRTLETQRVIDGIVTGRPGGTIDANAVQTAAREEANRVLGPAYDRVYNLPHSQAIWSPDLNNIINTAVGRRAAQDAIENMAQAGNLPVNGVNSPTLQFWDQVKRTLDDRVRQLYDSGDTTAAKATEAMRNHLRDELKSTVPEYGQLLSDSSRYIRGRNAFEAGSEFFHLANTNRRNPNIADLGAQMQNYRNVFTPAEQELFATGLASYIRANPDDAAKVFASGNRATLNHYREVLGANFEPIESTMLVHNTARLLPQIAPIAPRISTLNEHALTGAIGIGAQALHGVSPASVAMQAMAHSALLIHGVRAKNEARQIIEMAADPSKIGDLTELVRNNERFREAMRQLQPNLARAASLYGAERQSDRPGHARGGKIRAPSAGKHKAKAMSLIRAAEQAKKAHNSTTEPTLDMPDEMVAKALSIADKAI